jgi:hypothetical protein
MKKIFTSLLVALTFCTVIIATVQTELRMHVFRNGDNGQSKFLLSEVDSVKFMNDTLESEKLYTSKFYNDGKLFDTFTDCSYDSVPVLKPNRDTTAAYTYTFKGWKRDESEIAKNKLTYTAIYDSIIRKYAVVFFGENSEVYSLASLAYGTMPVNPVDKGINPAKASTRLHDFVFYKWNPDLAEVEADIAYRAEFESRMHPYTCMFYNCDTLFKTVDNCAYDYEPAIDTPKRESTGYAYEFKEWSKDTSKVARDTLIYTAVYDSSFLIKKNGAIRYAYKISETDSVYFSQGNLQFTTQGTHKTADGIAKGIWRFAENQWDVIGEGNANIAEDYTGWIDLFGWGTSGWNSGANSYLPWSSSEIATDYYTGESSSYSLIDAYANADWGIYNAISNGGDEPNKWRTLTIWEWQYLVENNKWTLGYIKTTEKDSSLCFFLIPDGFIAPSGVKVTVISDSLDLSDTNFNGISESSYADNIYSTEEFASLEESGVVALPCGGKRSGTTMHVGLSGYYWSSSLEDSDSAYGFIFNSTDVYSSDSFLYGLNFGWSVRLVQDLNLDIHFVNADGTTLLDTTVARGVIPTYTREKPTMDSTKASTYVFKGWDKKIVAAECDMVYTAVYDTFTVLYTSVFKDYDGTTIETVEKCAYDSVLAETPTRESIQDYDYEFLEWKRDESKILEKQLVYTAVYSMKYTGEKLGAIQVAYKVSDNDSVYFSRGNLQYCADNGTVHKTTGGTIAQGTWRFAENQWDVIGAGNANIDSTCTGWIDLFGWGTSGWNSKATCYQPWSKSETSSDYYPDDSKSNNLTGDYANADWGVYNAISNGGNEPNKWRTLTTSEWQYLFKNNKWTLGYIKTTEKDSSLCFMLIPETFTAPEGTTVTVLSTTTTSTSETGLSVPSTNKYTTEQFASLEKLGVVALPCGGCRGGTSVYAVGSYGYYWSSSADDLDDAYAFYFNSTGVYSNDGNLRYGGRSVRLVQDLK